MQKKRPNRGKKRQMRRRMAAVSLILVMLLGLGAFFVNSRYVFRYGLEGVKLDKYESGTTPIGGDEDPDAGVEVPEGSFRVHINHLPSYDNAKGYNLQIWNPSNNKYLMRVKILQTSSGGTSGGTENILYSSDLIRIGHKKDDVKLSAEAAAGTATAVFTAYDKKTLEKIGSTEVQITLPTVPTTP